jgi:hypothetical protein
VGVTFTDSTNTLRIYVDGALVTTATKALETDNPAHVVTVGNLRSSHAFSGVLDEVRLYSRALTLAEIQADRTTPITLPDTTPPSTVTGLTATAVSATQINLSWATATDNVGVTGYRVERCQGAGWSTFVQIATPSTNSYSNPGLTAGTSYSYRVKAVNEWQSELFKRGQRHHPSPPTRRPDDLTGSPQPRSQPDQSGWTAHRQRREQRPLPCGAVGVGCSTFAQIATPVTNSYPDPGFAAGTSYSHRARARRRAESELLEHRLGHTSGRYQPDCLWDERRGGTTGRRLGQRAHQHAGQRPTWVAGQATFGKAVFDGVTMPSRP